MPTLNPADLTFNGQEIKSISEAVFESVFAKPDLNAFHSVVEDIKVKTQIVILGRLNAPVGLGAGGCDPVANPATITNTEKFWQPATVSDRITECAKDLLATFFTWGLKNGLAKNDLTGTDYAIFLEERYGDEIKEAIFRIAWFGDTAAAIQPAGVIATGTNLALFNKIDGFWKQLFTIATATPARLTAGLGSRNGQASFALQEFTAADTTARVVTNTLQNMKYGSDTRFRALTNLTHVVTQSVSDQYERELIAAQTPYTSERLENGFTALKAGGITVLAFEFWDRMIRAYEHNGVKYNLPHRITLINPDNMQIGTPQSSAFTEMDLIYDKTSKKNHFDFEFDMDAKIILDYEIQLAY